ncbi:hypothetical protein ACRALDRAFT_2014829 [Sodiomyces alcalophilus JCM 7366]|uniref:uncharacterized protein n=1 Tax=Sodiomyces alcalophilus JCM 7366 TaxID=591952 RepID=UPI0039B4E999
MARMKGILNPKILFPALASCLVPKLLVFTGDPQFVALKLFDLSVKIPSDESRRACSDAIIVSSMQTAREG